MKSLVAHPATDAQLKAIIAFFEAMQIPFSEENILNETEQLMTNPVMIKRLDESIKELEERKIVRVSLEDIWK